MSKSFAQRERGARSLRLTEAGRERAPGPQPSQVIDLAGPEPMTGAALWSEVLARLIGYGGGDLDAMETALRERGAPGWLA